MDQRCPLCVQSPSPLCPNFQPSLLTLKLSIACANLGIQSRGPKHRRLGPGRSENETREERWGQVYQGRSRELVYLICGWWVGQGQPVGLREDSDAGFPEKSKLYIFIQNFPIKNKTKNCNCQRITSVLDLAHVGLCSPGISTTLLGS